MFADDTYISTAHDVKLSTIECSLNSDLTAVHNWQLKTNKLSCKTGYMTIGSLQNLAKAKFMNLKMDNKTTEF